MDRHAADAAAAGPGDITAAAAVPGVVAAAGPGTTTGTAIGKPPPFPFPISLFQSSTRGLCVLWVACMWGVGGRGRLWGG